MFDPETISAAIRAGRVVGFNLAGGQPCDKTRAYSDIGERAVRAAIGVLTGKPNPLGNPRPQEP